MMITLHSSQDLKDAIAQSFKHPIVLFKHSATCPFSAQAQEQVANSKHDLDIYAVVVQYAKELSEDIATLTGIEHASPQAIVMQNGKPTWSGWRSEIKKETLLNLAKQ